MKKILITFVCIILVTYSFCQTSRTQLTREDYLKKSKRQRTIAYLLLPVGVLSTGLGMIRFKNDDGSYGNSRNTVFLVSGLVAIGGSITLFIASSRNKNRSLSLSFKNETVPQLKKSILINRTVPSLALTCKISR